MCGLQEYHKHIGANIKAIRLDRGLTQRRLAFLCGVNPRTLRRLESGDRPPSWGLLDAVRVALVCEWGEIMSTERGPTTKE